MSPTMCERFAGAKSHLRGSVRVGEETAGRAAQMSPDAAKAIDRGEGIVVSAGLLI